MKTVFLRALESADKAQAIRAAISEPGVASGGTRFEVDVADFAAVPRSPFAYWVSQRLRLLFTTLPPFGSAERKAKHGAATLDDVRFVRTWFEVTHGGSTWVPFAKGGSHAPFYADVHLVLNWSGSGAELKAHASAVRERNGWGDQWTAVLNGYSYYFRPGLTWPHRSANFSAAALPAGCVFSQSGKAAFVPESELATLLALFNSAPMTVLARIQSDAVRIKFEVGLVERIPVPDIPESEAKDLDRLARRGWALKRWLDTTTETSHAFVLPALLQVEGRTLTARADEWAEHVGAAEQELLAIRAQIDRRCFDLYGIDETDRRSVTDGLASDEEGADAETALSDGGEGLEGDDGAAETGADEAALAARLVSWAVGVALGRFDVRLAIGARAIPAEPDLFDPLPPCSPGMLVGDDGLLATVAPPNYPVGYPSDGILVDDPGDSRDFASAVRAVFEIVFGTDAEALWEEAAALLDPRTHDLRVWLRSGFFEHHLKLHSKTRRKAPVMWQFGTPSGRYSVWLYAPRLTADSLFQLQNDVLAPKLGYEERQLIHLVQGSDGNPSAKERKEIDAQESFVDELRGLLENVKRVAPLWKPMLDDGVLVVMAPLCRLVVHKPWQRELEATWADLAAGKYDWAHLAMHLWPERVVPKCAVDRSLGIAHELDAVFWIEDDDGKWHPRETPTVSAEELIRDRTSSAAKDALHNLTTALAQGSASRRGRSGGATRRVSS